MKFRFGPRLPSHARFAYTPRYYDPEAEERSERRRTRERTYTEDNRSGLLKNRIQQGFQNGGRSNIRFSTETSRYAATSNKRILVIIVALTLMTYFILSANFAGLLEALKLS